MAAAWYSGCHVLHIVAIVIMWEFSGLYADTGVAFGKEIGKKLSHGKRVYDVSQVIRSNGHPNQSEILPEHLYVQEVNTSANYYFVANVAAYDDAYECWRNRACMSYYGIKGISLIFGDYSFGENANKADVLAMTDEKITYTKITEILKMKKSAIESVTFLFRGMRKCEEDIKNMNRYFVNVLEVSSIKQSIELGIEYSDELLKLCAEERLQLFEYLDHTILRIHVSPKTTMLSYAVFSRHVNKLIGENREFVRKICPHCTPYIRLENVDWNTTISAENYEKYNALMTSYLDAFSRQNSGKEIFIFCPTLKRSNFMPNNEFLRQNMSMFYHGTEHYENVSSQEKNHLACAHQRNVKLLLENVQNIFVYDPFLEVLSSLSTPCQTSTENAKSHFILPSNTSLSILLSNEHGKLEIDKQVEKIPEILGNNPAKIKIAMVFLRAVEFSKTGQESLKEAVNRLQSQNIDIGCQRSIIFLQDIEFATANFSTIIKKAFKECEAIGNLSTKISVSFSPRIRRAEDVLPFLIRLDQAKQHSERLYPGKTLILDLFLVSVFNFGMRWESLHCSPEQKQLQEYFQTIQTFGNIQGWSELMLQARWNDFGFWSRVRTDEQIDLNELEKFPVLFRSNAPPTAEKELPMTYPCVRTTWDVSKSNINFLENEYSATSFQTHLRETPPISTAELQTLLELALKRFPSVEINAVSQSDFKLVEKVVAANAPSHRNLNASTPSVFIEVPLVEVNGLRQDINKLLSNRRAAVHVSNWESLSDEQPNPWKGIQYPFTRNFGVAVQNCSGEIISKLTALKSLPFMPQVSYIVCNTPPVTPTNDGLVWMDGYLGTLFYTKSYMEHFLSIGRKTGNEVEVMFRLNYLCSKTIKMEQFLRFLDEVNQHSAAYKIRYFLVRAFEEEASVNCSHSWWYPDSYADLSNISTFVNREDEYAGRDARIYREISPAQEPAQVPEENSNAVYFIIFASVVALLMLGMLAQWLYQRKQRKIMSRILTLKEVSQFYDGDEQSNPSNANSFYLDFGNKKFPKHYEIPRKDIETEEIIGSGQFGVVHRGILSKRIEVAIKIPRSDCGKQQFKSTLTELKILCHIGDHMNIVSFLGAHTKGIANGKLYIVIEYCKNGSLLQHLRQNRENAEQESCLALFELYGFSLQIASGMEYIAEKRVIHADLAARNVLLTSELTCKIADFGLSRRLYELEAYVKTSQEPLPWKWMAPESLRDMEFTTKSDVWSYGVTLWEIFSFGLVPYPGLNWTVNFVAELENGMRMDKAPHATDDIHAKALDCWNLNSEARPSFTELKEFFVGLRNEQYLKQD